MQNFLFRPKSTKVESFIKARKLVQTTYGLRKIIRNVASGARCNNVLNDSLICSFAAASSSVCGKPTELSSSTLKRYRKHLSLNGCSLFTVKNKIRAF